MKLFEKISRTYPEADPETRRLLIHQLDADTLDFEAEECLAFLQSVIAREKGPVAAEARRTLRHLVPQAHALRYQLRQPTSTAFWSWAGNSWWWMRTRKRLK